MAASNPHQFPPSVHVSQHPCVQAKLSQLRSASTNARETKALVHEIATIVGCEALAGALTVQASGTDKSPLGYPYPLQTTSPRNIRLVPILRSGLSMIDAITSLLPEPVPVHHLGLYREKTTLQPVEYYNNLPYHKTSSSSSTNPSLGGGEQEESSAAGDLAIIIDPIIATGSTLGAAIETLREAGARRILAIAVLASATGLAKVAEIWPEGVTIWVGGVDAETDERGMIKPGLGDVGDRLFLTMGK